MAYYLVVSNDQTPVLLYNPNASTGTVSQSTSTPVTSHADDSKGKVVSPAVPKRKMNKSRSVVVGPGRKVLPLNDPKTASVRRQPKENTQTPRILRRNRSSVNSKKNDLPPPDLKETAVSHVDGKENTKGNVPLPPDPKGTAIPHVKQNGNPDCSVDPKVKVPLPPHPKGTPVPRVKQNGNPDCPIDPKGKVLPPDPKGTAVPHVDHKGSTQCPVDLKGIVLTLVPPTPIDPVGRILTLDPKGTAFPPVGSAGNTQSWVDLAPNILALLKSTSMDLNGKIITIGQPKVIVHSPVKPPEGNVRIPINSKTKTMPVLIPKGDLPPLAVPIPRNTKRVVSKTNPEKEEALAPLPAKKAKTDVATQEELLKVTPLQHEENIKVTPPEKEKQRTETPKQEEIITVMSPELMEPLKKSLPTSFPYKVTALEGRSPDSYEARIRVSIRTEIDAMLWMEEYKKLTKTVWRVNRTYLKDGCRVIYKKRFHCYRNAQTARVSDHARNTMTDRPHCRDVNCQARLTITIKNYSATKSKDRLLKKFPTEIHLQHVHNHQIDDSTLVRRGVDVSVREKLRTFFEAGHSQTSAFKTFKFDLQLQHGNDYPKVAADSLKCPTPRDVAYLYDTFYCRRSRTVHRKEKRKSYGNKGFYMLESLPSMIEKYNETNGGKCAAMIQYDKDVIVVVCSRLMKRIHHHLPSSGESCLMWSSGRVYRYNIKVFILLAPSPAGPLPLGILLVTSDSSAVLNKALEQYHSLLGGWAYHKRGKNKGPAVIITSNTPNERNTFKAMYCSAQHYLNVDDVLKEFWRIVIDEKTGAADPSDRIEIFRVFKSLVEWPQESTFGDQVRIALNYSVLVKYPSVARHLEKHLIPRVGEWAMCKRPQSLKTFNNCNDTMMKLLYRSYTFGVVPLFDFMVNHLEGYFREKLCARLDDRVDNFTLAWNAMSENKQPTLTCEKLSDNIYRVLDSGSGILNEVNMCVRVCTCQIGLTGCQCRHQNAVITEFNLKSVQSVPMCSDRAKSVLHLIVHGDWAPSEYSTTEVSDAVAAITDEATRSGEAITEEATAFDEAVAEETTKFDEAITELATEFDEAINKKATELNEVIPVEATELDEAITVEATELDEAITEEATEFDEAITEEATELDEAITEEARKIYEAITEEARELYEAITEEARELDEAMTEETGAIEEETTVFQGQTTKFDEAITEEDTNFGEAMTEETAVFNEATEKETTVIQRETAVFDETMTGKTLTNETPVLIPEPKDANAFEPGAAFLRDSTTEGRTGDAKSRIQKCESRLQRVSDCLLEKLRLNPALYVPTMEKFLDNFEEASETDESMIYALASFCQFTGHVEVEVEENFRQNNSNLAS